LGVQVETEIKLRSASLPAVRERLLATGAVPRLPRHLEENVLFDRPGGELRAAGTVLRLRRTPHGGVLTWKGCKRVEAGVRSRPEAESGVADAEATEAILRGLGFAPTFRYQKYRETLGWRGLDVALDETPLGDFVELEGEGARAAAFDLGFLELDVCPLSYVELWLASGRGGDMIFR
jgi:adenylate cyclase class 2